MLVEKQDFYFNKEGKMVLTQSYHLKRGYCCKNKCIHCPWNYGQSDEIKVINR
ncbi:hypothetical protein ADIARSV_3583 [Arcticibacter svalbardensis MN12-7]|uniref:Uncharacterized protein n=1 Tax=Arcticibacter svalbardensis MN12-7 TaxID=1150600 RepID=R9GWF0_9SPHI|nr:DUF5522 domain-containing protein [Arcticibacter svalbardensis]EOR93254.1 hypothetical protein ADIARSV_3583 [Arcticibacter svalbardensis MN12-7]